MILFAERAPQDKMSISIVDTDEVKRVFNNNNLKAGEVSDIETPRRWTMDDGVFKASVTLTVNGATSPRSPAASPGPGPAAASPPPAALPPDAASPPPRTPPSPLPDGVRPTALATKAKISKTAPRHHQNSFTSFSISSILGRPGPRKEDEEEDEAARDSARSSRAHQVALENAQRSAEVAVWSR